MLGKYCSFDEKNHIIISFEQAKLINVDFNQFYMNWSNYDGSSKLVKKKNKILEDKSGLGEKFTFKPHIGNNSKRLYERYRQKIKEELELESKINETLPDKAEKPVDKSKIEKSVIEKSIIKSQNKSRLSAATAVSPRHMLTLEYVNLQIKKKQRQWK